MMHVLFERGLEDADYIARHTLGIEQLRERAREYTPERVSAITGIPAETIVVARRALRPRRRRRSFA